MSVSSDAYLYYGFDFFDEDEDEVWGEQDEDVDEAIEKRVGKIPEHIKIGYHCCLASSLW